MTDNALHITFISGYKDSSLIIDKLEKSNYDVKECWICKAKIYNTNEIRAPNDIFEKFLSLFGIKFHDWRCNLGGIASKFKKVYCSDLSCMMTSDNQEMKVK